MRIYFARHGESEANLLREFSNRGRKHGLTANGRAQASQLAAKLAGAGIDRLISSPLLRAQQSAEIVGQALGITPEDSDALREWDVGVLEGRSDEAAWDQYWRLRRDWAEGHPERCIEGGESLLEVASRFLPFITGLTEPANTRQCVLLIGHGGLYSAALPLLLKNIPRDFAERNGLDNASYVVADSFAGALLCTEWAGIAVGR